MRVRARHSYVITNSRESRLFGILRDLKEPLRALKRALKGASRPEIAPPTTLIGLLSALTSPYTRRAGKPKRKAGPTSPWPLRAENKKAGGGESRRAFKAARLPADTLSD